MSYGLPDTMYFGRGALTSGSDLTAKVGYTAVITSEVPAIGADNGAAVVGVIVDGGTATTTRVAIGYGHVLAIAGAAVATADLISTDSAGRVITAASGDAGIGRALSKSAAAGDVLEIFIYGPVDESVA